MSAPRRPVAAARYASALTRCSSRPVGGHGVAFTRASARRCGVCAPAFGVPSRSLIRGSLVEWVTFGTHSGVLSVGRSASEPATRGILV
jgi:hypothetical protein